LHAASEHRNICSQIRSQRKSVALHKWSLFTILLLLSSVKWQGGVYWNCTVHHDLCPYSGNNSRTTERSLMWHNTGDFLQKETDQAFQFRLELVKC
jgi:hypothetical protein